MVSKKTMSCFAAILYLLMTVVLDFSLTSYVISQIDPKSINHGLYSSLTIWLFGIPAFFVGFILFVMMDWGLKRVLYKPSPLALLPIVIGLTIPFIWEHIQAPDQNQIFIPIASSAILLIWSVFVVGLQLWLGHHQKDEEKAKHSL